MADVDRRLMDLEIKVAFQENLIGELDDVIRSLRHDMERLHEVVDGLRDEVARARPDEPSNPDDERPPHY